MLIKLLEIGHCTHPHRIIDRRGNWRPKKFPAHVAVMQHPTEGFMLFDTGYAERFSEVTAKYPEKLYQLITPMYLKDSEFLINQLLSLGIMGHQIRYIFISHFHADHIAGLKDFPDSKFICSRIGFQNALNLGRYRSLFKGFLPKLLPDDFSKRTIFLEDCKRIKLKSFMHPFCIGYDVFNDGLFSAISLPGHASGHYGLLSKYQKNSIFLIGDAAFTMDDIEKLSKPSKIPNLLFDNVKAYYETLDQLAYLYSSNHDVKIIPTHCYRASTLLTGEKVKRQ